MQGPCSLATGSGESTERMGEILLPKDENKGQSLKKQTANAGDRKKTN